MEALDGLEQAVRDVRTMEIEDDRATADVVGRIDKAVRSLTSLKRSLMSELAGPTEGALYRIAEERNAKRSYNTAGLLNSFAAQDISISDLIKSDAVRLSWQWTNLKRAAYDYGVEMRTAPGEIEDTGEIDGPLVGEVWQTRQKIEAT